MPTPKPTKVPASQLRVGDRILVTKDISRATGWDSTKRSTPWNSPIMPARVRTGDSITVATVQTKDLSTLSSRLTVGTDVGVIMGARLTTPFLRLPAGASADQPEPAGDTSDLPDWVRVGAKVAEYTPRGSFNGATARTSTITRLTATQVVCDSGNRFRRDTLRIVGDHWGARLLPVNDSDVRNVWAREAVERMDHEIKQALRGAKHSTVAGAAVLLDELSAVLEQARQRIARLNDAEKGDDQ